MQAQLPNGLFVEANVVAGLLDDPGAGSDGGECFFCTVRPVDVEVDGLIGQATNVEFVGVGGLKTAATDEFLPCDRLTAFDRDSNANRRARTGRSDQS